MGTFKVTKIFFDILSMPNINHFSAVEIRTAYIAANKDCSLDPSVVRRNIYAELLKLVKKGWLKKQISKKRGIITYTKTEIFRPELLFEYIPIREIPKSTMTANIKNEFFEHLHTYKSKLLEGLGEAEEYKRLRQSFPEMHDVLQPKYNDVREFNSRLLGKIQALETIILLVGKK
jgi:hypothetical protein